MVDINKGKLAPSTENYVIGKGFLVFRPEGETDFFHLGNVPSFVFTPAVEKLDHFSSMLGTREKDKSIVIEKTATITITMEEFTARNLALLLMGQVDDTDPDDIKIDIYATTALTGELHFYATNDVGPRWRFFLNQVQFTPSGDFSPISEEYAQMEVTGDVFAVDGVWGEAHLVSSAAPENITLPFVTGNAVVGESVTVSSGGWLDVDSFTYAWKTGSAAGGPFTAITPAQTGKTYVPVVGDVGKFLTCDVTGTNTEGNDTVTALPSGAVEAAAVMAATRFQREERAAEERAAQGNVDTSQQPRNPAE